MACSALQLLAGGVCARPALARFVFYPCSLLVFFSHIFRVCLVLFFFCFGRTLLCVLCGGVGWFLALTFILLR